MTTRAGLLRLPLRSRSNIRWERVVGIMTGALVVYLLIGPLGMLLFSSFRATKELLPFEATTWTFGNYIEVFTSEVTYRLLSVTLQYVLIALVIGLGLATLFAWFIERTNAPARSLLVVMVLASMGVPPIVGAMAAVLLANPINGILNVALRNVLGLAITEGPINIYSVWGMGVVIGLMIVPSSYIMISSVMARVDPVLEEASLASGVSQRTTFRRITAPLLRPALLAVLMYYTVIIIEVFEVPALLGMPRNIFVFSTLIYRAIHPLAGHLPDLGLASGYAILCLALACSLIYMYHRNVRMQERFAVVTGKGYRPKLVQLRKRLQVVLIGSIGIYVILSTVLPLLVLLWASLGILEKPLALASASLQYYVQLIHYPGIGQSILNTLVVSVSSASITMVLALVISWLAIRSGMRLGYLPDRLTFVSVAMPNIVIALALIFLYIRFPIPIYGTVWIIVIAQVTRYTAWASRLMNASYLQIHRELEEASLASGASWFSGITRVVLPILWPTFTRGWLWVFVHALRDVTLALTLYTVYNDTIGVRMWVIWMEQGNFSLGAAMAVPLMLVSLGLSFLIARPTIVHSEVKA